MADHPFAKDLGYLFPFFERVAAHAEGLPEAQAARLRGLLEGEAERWREIAGLLEGAEPSAEAPMDAASSEGQSAEAAPVGATSATSSVGWTVGPLNRKG